MKPEETKTAQVNYFTCTLGQAAAINASNPHPYGNINEFLEVQARKYPTSPSVGFPIPADDAKDWTTELYSFEELYRGTLVSAQLLKELLAADNLQPGSCVALICPSSVEFLFVWLGLIRLGHSVLLIAHLLGYHLTLRSPQCQSEAIAHLCQVCDVSVIIYHASYEEKVLSAVEHATKHLLAKIIPWHFSKPQVEQFWNQESRTPSESQKIDAHSVAYIHHTSGTSTGLPKPIPQSHQAAIGVLPNLDQSHKATFTTTPLFHGGVADCFRAWTSGDIIWLFPGGSLPITQRNIYASLETISRGSEVDLYGRAQVRYFSSVPYILQMMAEDASCLSWLRKMDIVGVGGAALPQTVGDSLVKQGVNLISRFGSAECGFLLNSHRDYTTDREWQYLRHSEESQFLSFEKQPDGSGLSELVVLEGWPHMAKTNRENGSFATSDLFEPHKTISNAWRYHSRSDSQITLVTGKKFDPAPLEDALAAAIPEISDVLVFGDAKEIPGALLIVADEAQQMSDEGIIACIWPAISNINSKGQDHTRISKNMLVIVREGKLEKSSKGTILRNVANATFQAQIEAAYSQEGINVDGDMQACSQNTTDVVNEVVSRVLGRDLDESDEFYTHGVDSASCTRIRNLLQKHFSHRKEILPWNVVYDCKNISGLIRYLDEPNGKNGDINAEDGVEEMLDMASRYSDFSGRSPQQTTIRSEDCNKRVVILTGATGALGAHILSQLIKDPITTKIICLVRASSHNDARARVLQNLQDRHLMVGLDSEAVRVECYAAQLDKESLGLSNEEYKLIRRDASMVVHAAWPVNFSLPLSAFPSSIQGLHNLLLTLVASPSTTKQPTFTFCSSTASVLNSTSSLIPEQLSTNAQDSSPLGYSKSKWVAEKICHSFALQNPDIRVNILRVGQLTGDTEFGVWNMTEAYPLMLSTVGKLGCLPRIKDALDWLPLDIAAEVIVDIAVRHSAADEHNQSDSANFEVYHVLNPRTDTTPSFTDLLAWITKTTTHPFEIVDPSEWMDRLEALDEHPAKALLGLWRAAYGEQRTSKSGNGVPIFEVRKAGGTRMDRAVDEEVVLKIWGWLQKQISAQDQLS